MLFTQTWQKVLSGQKTQTRRLIKGVNLVIDTESIPGATDSPYLNGLAPIRYVLTEEGNLIYEVDKTYAVQPGRGRRAIWWKDAYTYSTEIHEDALPMLKREGWRELRIRITAIRGPEDVRQISVADVQAEGFASFAAFLNVWCGMHDAPAFDGDPRIEQAVKDRPAERYNAWVLDFEVVREVQP